MSCISLAPRNTLVRERMQEDIQTLRATDDRERAARELARYAPDSDVEVHVNMWQRFPHTLATLRALNRRTDGGLRHHQRIEVGYVSPDPASGAIELIVR